MLGAPVATTPAAKGAFDERDPLSAGVVGSYVGAAGGRGHTANAVVRRADLVLLVGTATGSGATANWTVPDPAQPIVHLDVDPEEIGRNYPASFPLVGDATLGLEAIASALDDASVRDPWAGDLRPGAATGVATRSGDAIDPAELVDAIGAAIDDDAIVVADAGYCAVWALDRLRLGPPGRRFLSPSAYGTLGYGLPAAIGAKLASPGSSVICVTGDGGLGFSLGELETAARLGISVTVIVLNNGVLGWSRHYDRHFYGYEGATRFAEVDHAAVARGLGCEGVRLTDVAKFPDALAAALASPTTTVIDAITDPDARPPVDMFD
jgi:acetolactate synthase-1/2/3 large subunit